LLILVGEPGVGKTRLAQEITELARAQGFRILTGRCYEPQQTVGYYPFLEALAQAVGVMTEAAERWPEVARLLPESDPTAHASGPLNDPTAQQRLFYQVRTLLETLAERQPLALLVDDLHWADEASLALLQHLARQTRDQPLLLVGTARAVEARRLPPLAAALSDLRRDDLVREVSLQPLDEEETATLLAATLLAATVGGADGAQGGAATIAPHLVHHIYQRSEGNAFFTRQLAQALLEQGALTLTEGAWRLRETIAAASTPESIRSIIAQRLSRLTAHTQEVLREASVLGQVVIFDEVRGMSHRGEQEVEEALEEAAAAGIVREGAHEEYHFNHVLTRDTLYAEISAHKRRRFHRQAADAIEALPQPERRAAELSYHLLAAEERARALPYTLLAGDQAESVYAHAEAEGHYRAALQLAQEVGDQQQVALALEKLARALCTLRRFGDTLETATQGMAVCGALGDIEAEARMVWLLGQAHMGRATPQEGIALLPPQVEDLRRRGVSQRAVIWLQLQLILLWEGVGRDETFGWVAREALATAEQIVAVARTTQETTLLVDALVLVSRIATDLRNYEAELVALEEAVALDAPGGDPWAPTDEVGTSVYAVRMLAYAYATQGKFEQSRQLYARALAKAIRTGNPENLRSAYLGRGWHALLTGDWTLARSDFEQAEDVMRKAYGVSSVAPLHLYVLGVAEGHVEAESTAFLELLARIVKAHNYDAVCNIQTALAERDLLDDQVASARERLQPLLDEHHDELDEDNLIIVLTHIAWVNLVSGDVARAEEQVAESKSRLEATGWRRWLVDALRVEALMRMVQRRWPEAQTALEEALTHARAMPYPYAEAKALWVYGRLELARGAVAAAHERFAEALSICDRLGEGLYRRHIERDLRRLAQPG
jgi:tetratricopeptide (TPR) repeat protein